MPATVKEIASDAVAGELKASSTPMMLDVGWVTMIQDKDDDKDAPDILVHVVEE